jgi:hypothetical protein
MVSIDMMRTVRIAVIVGATFSVNSVSAMETLAQALGLSYGSQASSRLLEVARAPVGLAQKPLTLKECVEKIGHADRHLKTVKGVTSKPWAKGKLSHAGSYQERFERRRRTLGSYADYIRDVEKNIENDGLDRDTILALEQARAQEGAPQRVADGIVNEKSALVGEHIDDTDKCACCVLQ